MSGRLSSPQISLLSIAIGRFPSFSVNSKFGENAAVGTTFEDVWSNSGTFTYLAAAAQLDVTSTSTADTSAGTGAQTIRVEGLDTNWAELEEDVTMNGQSDVQTSGSFIRVNRMTVLTAGSGAANAGTITISSGANVISEIPVSENQTLQTHFAIPAGKTATFDLLFMNVGKNDDATFRLRVRSFGGVFQTKLKIVVFQGDISHPIDFALNAAAKSDIVLQAKAGTGSIRCAGGYDFVLF